MTLLAVGRQSKLQSSVWGKPNSVPTGNTAWWHAGWHHSLTTAHSYGASGPPNNTFS